MAEVHFSRAELLFFIIHTFLFIHHTISAHTDTVLLNKIFSYFGSPQLCCILSKASMRNRAPRTGSDKPNSWENRLIVSSAASNHQEANAADLKASHLPPQKSKK